MSSKNEHITVHLTKRDREKVEAFADARCPDDSLYQKRGGFKREDIVVGALAEIAVYKLLKQKGLSFTKPDFTIHKKKEKSYDADLTDYQHFIHVKGQSLSSKHRYGSSWLMQRSDPLVSAPERKHYLAPCTVDLEKNWVDVHCITPFRSIVDREAIGECAVPWFQKYKVAIYLDQLESFLTAKSRWGFFQKAKARIAKER